jgi:prepilin-type N-terminal cleavage/methylation domain-containing protein
MNTQRGLLQPATTLAKRHPQQKGFTLVEMAIVLVIIGLLLGGVLKGQELVVQARVKSIVNDFNQTTAAYYTYFDRYHKFPGDDKSATIRWTAITTTGNSDGVLGVAGDNKYKTASTENVYLWQHLRYAGIVSGDATKTDATAFPANSVGGVTGIQEGAYGMTETVICTDNVPVKLAELIDYAIDDGVAETGILRSSATISSTADTTLYSNATANQVVCRKL